ncbi:hypothetical protein [Achromobacter xylosoxidans]|uniref:hypothetical protein n=1 Tax=Alcaligenes xylosoxydans xylosoxydans TaxID=85698 RepID=UPI00131B92A5|nr:hypothetical protein [Achromobacter xylosoxidans]
MNNQIQKTYARTTSSGSVEEAVLTRLLVVLQLRDHQANAQDFFADHGDQPLYRGATC